jgi:antitoxin (DNA-binding transcriptional repressor) of toxin-antitoxin stability system
MPIEARFDQILDVISVVWQGKLVARMHPAGEVQGASTIGRSDSVTERDSSGPIGLQDFRKPACAYLDRVADGETIEVLRRGKLVARIVSAAGDPRGAA